MFTQKSAGRTPFCLGMILAISALIIFLVTFKIVGLEDALASTSLNSCGTLSTQGETYILDGNLSNAGSDCLVVAADDITIDGNGFTVDGNVGAAVLAGASYNFEVRNITITGSLYSTSISGTDGGSGGNLEINNSIIQQNVTVSGSNNQIGGGGGNGGNLIITNSSVGDINSNGGNGSNGADATFASGGESGANGGAGGSGGNVLLLGTSTANNISSNGGSGGNGGNGASGAGGGDGIGGNGGSGGDGGNGGDGGDVNYEILAEVQGSTTLGGGAGGTGGAGGAEGFGDTGSGTPGNNGALGTDGSDGTLVQGDSIPPIVSLSAPTTTVGGDSVEVAAIASDYTGVVGVKFYINGDLIGSEDFDSPYTEILDSTGYGSGPVTFSAVARDAAGNVATSSSNLTLDNTAPTASSIVVSTNEETATVTWSINESTTPKIYYGTTPGVYTLSTSTPTFVNGGHTLVLSDLEISTPYYYVIVDTDLYGNISTTTELNFISLPWTEQTNSGSRVWRSMSMSEDGSKLAVVDRPSTNPTTGYIYTSQDYGITWTTQTNAGLKHWNGIVMSSDGSKLAATNGSSTGAILTSTNSGVTWVQQTGAGTSLWARIVSSGNGTKLLASLTTNPEYLYGSSDSGLTWTERTSAGSRQWGRLAVSSDGTKQAATAVSGYIYTSEDSGVTWTAQTDAGSRSWNALTYSRDGTFIAAAPGTFPGYIYTSSDSGDTWTEQRSLGQKAWSDFDSSEDGRFIVGIAGSLPSLDVYVSQDYGINWTKIENAGTRNWSDVEISSDGLVIAASTLSGYIYTSNSSGRSGGGPSSSPAIDPQLNSGAATAVSSGGGSSPVYVRSPDFGLIYTPALPTNNGVTLNTILSGLTKEQRSEYIKDQLSDYEFTRDLGPGLTAVDVLLLQRFLNLSGYPVSPAAFGSFGRETQFYGPLTQAAVASFQKAVNIEPAEGYFGPITRGYVNNLLKSLSLTQ